MGKINDPFALNDPPDTRTRVTLDVGELSLVREGLDALQRIATAVGAPQQIHPTSGSTAATLTAERDANAAMDRDAETRSIARSLKKIEYHLDWLPFSLGFYLICAIGFHACITNHDITVKLAPPLAEATAKP